MDRALKGRGRLRRPFRADPNSPCLTPGLTPWAVLFRPFRAGMGLSTRTFNRSLISLSPCRRRPPGPGRPGRRAGLGGRPRRPAEPRGLGPLRRRRRRAL